MDFIHSIRKLETGFINPLKFSHKIRYNSVERICSESPRKFAPSDFDTLDFSLCNNWLLAAHNNFSATIYDVNRSDVSTYEAKGTWRRDENCSLSSYDCANWNSECSFFSYSGRSPFIYIVETETLITTETHQIKDAKIIFQHKPHPTKNHLLAAATNLKTVSFIDLKSGNISCTVTEHGGAVKSVAWAPLHEYLLVSAGDCELNCWDIRMTKKVYSYKTEQIFRDSSCPREQKTHLPEVQFIPGTNTVIGNLREHIYKFDLINIKPLVYEMPLKQHKTIANYRLKFSLVGYCEPPVMFYPFLLEIDIVNLEKMETISKLNGHIFPVKTTVYNEKKNELYTATGIDDNIVWVTDHTV